LFDPKDRTGNPEYDPSIRFVEELDKANQQINQKSQDLKLSAPDLGFKGKLSSQKDAFYAINQLYSLKELVILGLERDVVFKSIVPLPVEKSESAGIRVAKSRLELLCPMEAVTEFFLALNTIAPRACVEAFLIKSTKKNFDIDLDLQNIVIDLDWMQKEKIAQVADMPKVTPPPTDISKLLLENSPFRTAALDGENTKKTKTAAETKPVEINPAARFFYRGKARLKSKEVVVIEDTLKKQTQFVELNGIIDSFSLKSFTESEAFFTNLKDGKELMLKRVTNP
jgi:hypothetical protein